MAQGKAVSSYMGAVGSLDVHNKDSIWCYPTSLVHLETKQLSSSAHMCMHTHTYPSIMYIKCVCIHALCTGKHL